MRKFKVKYIRTVTETYEATIETETEEDVIETVMQSKYGEEIDGEELVDSYSDHIEIDEIEEVKG